MQTVSLFFTADIYTLPYLSVALQSVRDNASRNAVYDAYVLHEGIAPDALTRLSYLQTDNFSIRFYETNESIRSGDCIPLQIARMFPDLNKALYLHCDVVVTSDVAELFAYDLGDDPVGAVPDETVLTTPYLREYAESVLGIPAPRYYNTGVLLLNLRALRNECISDAPYVSRPADEYFSPEQERFNELFSERVRRLPQIWNKMPLLPLDDLRPRLVHFSQTRKPWRRNGVPYREYFWKYAARSAFLDDIVRDRALYA